MLLVPHPCLSTRFSLLLQMSPVLVLGPFSLWEHVWHMCRASQYAGELLPLRSSPAPRMDVGAYPSPVSPQYDDSGKLHGLPDFPSGTKLLFPIVVIGLMTQHCWLPSLPCVTSCSCTGVSWDYFPNELQLNACLRAASEEIQTLAPCNSR